MRGEIIHAERDLESGLDGAPAVPDDVRIPVVPERSHGAASIPRRRCGARRAFRLG